MKYFTKVKALNQISYLGSLKPKDGYEFHFSLFFKSKISDRKRMLDDGDLVLFAQNGLIDIGSLKNIQRDFQLLNFRAFTDEVTTGT